MSRLGFKSATGFTLIEVLVSMVILAIGLLGLAGMQTIALKDNQDAFFYAQASSLAYEISDRIKVNAVEWRAATLPTVSTDCNDSCNSVIHTCTPTQMAQYDYCAWQANVKSRIATGANATVAISPVTGSTVCNNGDTTKRCLTISWARNNLPGTTSSFQLEIQP